MSTELRQFSIRCDAHTRQMLDEMMPLFGSASNVCNAGIHALYDQLTPTQRECIEAFIKAQHEKPVCDERRTSEKSA